MWQVGDLVLVFKLVEADKTRPGPNCVNSVQVLQSLQCEVWRSKMLSLKAGTNRAS
jgi:hypothetical protein